MLREGITDESLLHYVWKQQFIDKKEERRLAKKAKAMVKRVAENNETGGRDLERAIRAVEERVGVIEERIGAGERYRD